MTFRLAAATPAALLVSLWCSLSLGDVPPPQPGQTSQQCTVPAQQRPGEQCVECAASYEQHDKCQRDFAAQGYTQRCRAPGASVWHEVWCRSASSPPPEKKRGCGACSVGAPDSGLPLGVSLGALGLLALLARRRR